MSKPIIRLRCEGARMAADNTGEIMLYGEIASDGWKWSNTDVSALDFDKALKAVKGASKLNVRINSPGGHVDQAVAMRAMLMNTDIPEIEFFIEGLCASAATLVACIPGRKVHIAEGSNYMIHNPLTWECGNASAMEKTAARLRQMESDFHGIYSNRSGQDVEQVKAWMDEEKWFTAAQAVEAGFADELISAEMPAVASVSKAMLDTMHGMYKHIPQDAVTVAEEPVSPGASAVAVETPSEIHDTNQEGVTSMDIKDLTPDQLRAENPELYASIVQGGENAERQRIQDIDDLTPAGYEEMATQAKADGTSAVDFHKQIVKAQREKGERFLQNRQKETASAGSVPGGAAEDAGHAGDDEKAIQANADEIAAFAKGYRATANETMY